MVSDWSSDVCSSDLWSGASLDFVIDYATYVFLPAFALSWSLMLSSPWNWICGGLVVFTGALYFADNGMKTPDGSFKGFPAGWNMVVFGLDRKSTRLNSSH